MADSDEDKVFDALAIRDTASHDSIDSMNGEFLAKNIVIYNSLDQNITFQFYGTRDKVVYIPIGNSFVVNASIDSYETVSDFFKWYRLKATCSTAPTSGVLDTWIVKAK